MPGPTQDKSASGAMVRKIIRRVSMSNNAALPNLPPKQEKWRTNNVSTSIMFKTWRAATSNRNNPEDKNIGNCGC